MVFSLVGCNTKSTSSNSDISESISESSSGSSSSSKSNESFEPLHCDEVQIGTPDGFLIDVNVGSYLTSEKSYDAKFIPQGVGSSIRIVSSHQNVLTCAQKSAGSTTFTLDAHSIGDSILSIYDNEDILIYRHVVHVRKGYSQEEIGQALFDNDLFIGYPPFAAFGDHRVNFVETSPLTMVLSGHDDVETEMHIECECTFVRYTESLDKYEYSLVTVDRDDVSKTQLTRIYVAPTADIVIVFYKISQTEEAILNMFVPDSVAEERGYK